MTKNEIESRLLEKAEHVIHREQAEMLLQKLGGQFITEKEQIEEFISLKQQVAVEN